ncbi:MAG TPA: hypothetical protein ENK85_08415 [Saprospiraceae bacterium]|nr:hypothetical protein [Saprospiraceae bacterium]
MRKAVILFMISGFFGLFLISCSKDANGLVTPEIQEGIHFRYDGAVFQPTEMTKSYTDGNVYFQGLEEPSKTEISFIIQDKMKEGKYNFANIYNVSMKFLPYDKEIFIPVAGKFNLYELDKEKRTLKALFDCVLKNKETGKIIQITEGSINIGY